MSLTREQVQELVDTYSRQNERANIDESINARNRSVVYDFLRRFEDDLTYVSPR